MWIALSSGRALTAHSATMTNDKKVTLPGEKLKIVCKHRPPAFQANFEHGLKDATKHEYQETQQCLPSSELLYKYHVCQENKSIESELQNIGLQQ